MSTFTPTGSTGGTFSCTPGSYAIGRTTVTTAQPTQQVTYKFTTTRRGLWFRVGSSAGAQDIVNDTEFLPGDHVFSFVPAVGTYYIEFQLRDVGEAVLSGLARVAAGDLALTTPWLSADLRSLRRTQSLDVQWWTARNYQTRVLERRGVNSWSLRKYQPIDGPFEPTNQTDITVAVNAQIGVATMSASAALFKTSDVGGLIRLTHKGQFQTEALSTVSETTGSIEVSGVGADARTFFYAIAGTFSGTVELQRSVGDELSWVTVQSFTAPASASLNDALDNQIVFYRLIMTAYTSGSATASLTYSGGSTDGVVRIVALAADNSATVDILSPVASTGPTLTWNWGSWSDRYGWPATVDMDPNGRLWFMRDDRYWASYVDDYESMDVGPLASDAISRRSSGTGSLARWLKVSGPIYIGLSDTEGFIGSTTFNEVIKPENVKATLKTGRGSSNADAIPHNGGVLFISRSGRRLYRMETNGEAVEHLDLTRLHEDISGQPGVSTFLEIAEQAEPEPRIWAIRSDGQAACSLFAPEEQVNAWQRMTHGDFQSVCRLPGTPEDDVYFVVERVINGVTRKLIEKLAPERWNSITTAWRLACATVYSGPPITTLTGLSYLNGAQNVYVWGDGRQSGPYTVTGGQIALDYQMSYAIVGLMYTGKYRGSRLNWGASAATALTQDQKVTHLGLVIHKTAAGCIGWGPDFEKLDYLKDRRSPGVTDHPMIELSEDQHNPFQGRTEKGARVCLVFDKAGPGEILGLVPLMHTNEQR